MEFQTKIDNVRFRDKDNGFTIFTSRDGGFKGVIDWVPAEGQHVRVFGEWGISLFNGEREFKFGSIMPDITIGPRELLRYAASITPGIGTAKEEAIWDLYGADWKTGDIKKIKGINSNSAIKWQVALDRIANSTVQGETIGFLLSKECTTNMANSAWNHFEESTIGKVTADPYVLATLPNYSFNHVDKAIRRAFGIGDDDPRRVRAGILYFMGLESTQTGTLMPSGPLIKNLLERGLVNVGNGLSALIETGDVVMVGKDLIALKDDYTNEKLIWDFANAI